MRAMKNFTLKLSIIVLGFLTISQLSVAQDYTVKSDKDQISLTNPEGEDVIQIVPQNKKGDFAINVAGFSISFDEEGNRYKEPKSSDLRSYPSFKRNWKIIDIGGSLLSSPNYSAYGPGNHEFLDLGGKSVHVSLNFISMSLSLNRRGNIGLSTGLMWVFENYVFANNITLVKENGLIQPLPVPENTKKTKFTTAAVRLPILLEFKLHRKVFFAIGPYGEWVYDGRTKYKKPTVKSHQITTDINQFRYGVMARFGFTRLFYIYGEYCASELFKSGRGPVTHPFSIGLGIGF